MSGLDLAEMSSTNMVDVIHYFFETDLTSDNPEYAEVKSDVRSMIYRDLYDTEYIYGVKKSQRTSTAASDQPFSNTPAQFDPDTPPKNVFTSKPYVPATDFSENSSDPFGGLLDPPLV